MMKYNVYNLDFFDESIEENNAYGQCLSKQYAEKLEKDSNSEVWISSINTISIDKILEYYWDKKDIDNFVKENPETAVETFIVCKWDKNSYKEKYYKYCPQKDIRNSKINKILK